MMFFGGLSQKKRLTTTNECGMIYQEVKMPRTNQNAINLLIGDLVTTDFYPNENQVVRKITSMRKQWATMGAYVCHWLASADGSDGGIQDVDASWFIPVTKEAI